MMGKPLGPGPGAYRLPPTVGFDRHDGTRYRNPMYSFGDSCSYKHRLLGPGPSYKIDRVTKTGVETSPAWSLGATFPPRRLMRMPGPGAHAPERCPRMKDARPPAYSLGARLGYMSKSRGPASNAYSIRFGPDSPSYSMAARLGTELKRGSPGPAVYFQRDQNVNGRRAPLYSLGAKLGATLKSRTPGPAAYPQKLYDTKKQSYVYSFGTHHNQYAPPMIVDGDTMDCI